MQVEFPKEEIPPDLVESRYKLIIDMHMHHEKVHIKQEFSYIKYAGFFLFAFLGFRLMESKGIIGEYLIAAVCTGFGVFTASLMAMLFITSDNDYKLSLYEKEGKALEESFPSEINFKYFQAISRLATKRYRIALLTRLVPFAFVGIVTIWSATILLMRMSSSLAITVGVGASVALLTISVFLAMVMQKNQEAL